MAVGAGLACGHAAQIVSWGVSAEHEELFALELYAGELSPDVRPAFKYVGNIHGDEPSGRCGRAFERIRVRRAVKKTQRPTACA
eukprot:366413-Chlamydomonas_euryale.AAC.6